SFSQGHPLFTSNMMVEGKFYYGFIYAHHLELELFNSHLPAFEINLQQETYGKMKWERYFAYPQIGVSLLYSPLGKSPILGDAYALFPFINFPLVRSGNFMLGFRFGLGVGYLTKKFDRTLNYQDIAIGSHFNAAVNIMLEARYRLSYRLTLSAGITLQHFSNGSLKTPNYGLNLPMANVGLAYRLVRENRKISDHVYPPTEPFEAIIRHRIDFYFGLALGYKNMQAEYGKNFIVYHIYENTLFPVSRKSKFGFGFDLSYDPSHITILEAQGDTVTNKLKILRPGINAAYELVMSRLGVFLNIGYYLGGAEKSNGPFYEKLALQYDFLKNFFASVMLKVHWGRADYIGWGLGYRFNTYYGRKTIK
ncbi:MAG TPA: acyloxyacyl hydrolase, partial [Bacteroidales bacterium]|nr:acyloxyacyl hydrolase [Bacteroidales bacterium]